MKKVIVYSTPTCTYCSAAKEFFKENNVSFEEYNVASDTAKRKEMVDKSGQLGVPVILVGEEVIVGFNRDKIAASLGIKA